MTDIYTYNYRKADVQVGNFFFVCFPSDLPEQACLSSGLVRQSVRLFGQSVCIPQLYFELSACLSVCVMLACQSVCLPVSLSVCLSACQPVCLPACEPVCLPACL